MPSTPKTASSPGARTEGFVVPAGPSIIEKLWAELDLQMRKLLSLREDPTIIADDAGQSGLCLGLAKALSIILNPYDPDVNEVRREAMRRYRNKGSVT